MIRVDRELPIFERHIPPKAKVLDLCCGGGIFIEALLRRGFDVVGVDILTGQIRLAPRDCVICGDASCLGLTANTFDAVLFVGNNLPHFSLSSFSRVAEEARRVLKSNGIMIVGYVDIVRMILENYKKILVHETKGTEIVSIDAGYDSDNGFFRRLMLNLRSKDEFSLEVYIWGTWMVRHILSEACFELIFTSRESFSEGLTEVEVYRAHNRNQRA